MQKIRIFYPDKDNKVNFTKEELEKLLNEVYSEGYTDGKLQSWTITTPTYTPLSTNPTVTWNTTTNTEVK